MPPEQTAIMNYPIIAVVIVIASGVFGAIVGIFWRFLVLWRELNKEQQQLAKEQREWQEAQNTRWMNFIDAQDEKCYKRSQEQNEATARLWLEISQAVERMAVKVDAFGLSFGNRLEQVEDNTAQMSKAFNVVTEMLRGEAVKTGPLKPPRGGKPL